jgi:hypothetical protein
MCLEGERLSCYLPAKLEKTMPNRLINKTAIISGGVEAFCGRGFALGYLTKHVGTIFERVFG